MSVNIHARAPLRLGLAGGGTDVSPYCTEHGGFVLNATIDLYAHAIIEPRNDSKIIFKALDRNEYYEFDSGIIVEEAYPLRLHRGIYNKIVSLFADKFPLSFTLTTYADAPAGSGLGTSSTMVVAIIKAFCSWLKLGLGEYDIAHLAYIIEREDLGYSGGRQDQYSASFGGFNFMEFGPAERVLINPLRINESFKYELESSLILFYTGNSRESANIINDQIDNVSKNSFALDAMHCLKQDSIYMKEYLLRGDITKIAETMQTSWEAKKTLAKSVTNSHLNKIYDDVISAGALSGKISGAGGGGFFMFLTPPSKRFSVLNCLNSHNGHVINFHFSDIGCHSWETDI